MPVTSVTLCIDWLRGRVLGGKAISSMDDLREAYLKRERESRCRLLVMSSWPDVGALVISWKKANKARRTKFSLVLGNMPRYVTQHDLPYNSDFVLHKILKVETYLH